MNIFSLRPDTPNIGNGLIALATDAMLRSIFGSNVNLVSIPLRANGHSKGGGLTAQTVYEINQLADGLIIGPGNLFENGALNVDPCALAALSVPTMLFGVSMGRVFGRDGRLISRTDSTPDERILSLCRVAEPILVRDGATMHHLKELGCDQARVIGCPTLFMGDDSLAVAPHEPALAESVLISIRNPTLMSIPYSVQGRINQDLRRIIDAFRGLNLYVRLLCHDYQDLRFAQAFPDTPLLYTEDPMRFVSWLRGCGLSISFRLHAFLCCLTLGTPSIPLTYDERGMSLIETIGLSDWAVPLLHTDDLLGDVYKRYKSLPRLGELKRTVSADWGLLRQCAVDGLKIFGERMVAHASQRKF